MELRFWKSAGLHLVQEADNGWLETTADFIRAYLTRPEGAGLALLAGLPLYASGSVLGGISTAAQTDAGGRLPHPRAAAAFGATAGVVATGLLLPTAPMPGSLLIGCLVALSLGGMVFGDTSELVT